MLSIQEYNRSLILINNETFMAITLQLWGEFVTENLYSLTVFVVNLRQIFEGGN